MKEPHLGRALATFKEHYPSVVTDLDEKTGSLLAHLPAPANLRFTIAVSDDEFGNPLYEVVCEGKAKLHAAITASIDSQVEEYGLGGILVSDDGIVKIPEKAKTNRS